MEDEVLELLTIDFMNCGKNSKVAESLAKREIKRILWIEILNIEAERDADRNRRRRAAGSS